MTVEFVTYGDAWEDSGAYLMKQVRGHTGAYITQASVSSMTMADYDLSSTTPDTSILTATLTVSEVIFDTLQTDARWDRDSTGYNVGISAPASWFPTGDHLYKIEVKVTPTSGAVLHLVWIVHAHGLATS